MYGNTWEWCQDFYWPYDSTEEPEDDNAVLRSYGWEGFPNEHRSANREFEATRTKGAEMGVRLVMDK